MRKVVLDTDVSSHTFLKRLTPHVKERIEQHTLCMSFATLGELTKWHVFRDWGRSEGRASLSGGRTSSS
jgi:hypothetical protein